MAVTVGLEARQWTICTVVAVTVGLEARQWTTCTVVAVTVGVGSSSMDNMHRCGSNSGGWKLVNGQYAPLWQTLEEQVDGEVVTITCSCKSAKCKQCSCAKKDWGVFHFANAKGNVYILLYFEK